MSRRLLALGVAAMLLLGTVPAVEAASPATFGTPTATSTFGTGVHLTQPVTITQAIGRVELLLTIADAIGPEVIEISPPPLGGSSTLSYQLDTSGDAHMIPNTPITARWRLYAAADATSVAVGPAIRVVYADDRFAWQTVSGPLVRVHWYEGDAGFGAKALKLGEDEVRDTSKLLGVTETRPIDFFVYADRDKFYDALGPGTHENVAGTAFANIRTLLGLIPPDQINDPQIAVRIPHEFVHMVFDTAARNPYHFPPRWLNEGLAVYQSESYGSQDRALVKEAAASGTLIPLDGLTGEYPHDEAFFLAYAESVSAVDFMVRTYGSDALVSLIRSYADGRTDDEAFKAALGVDMTAFGKAWFDANHAKPPTKYGPQPAPAGPVPSAWTGTGGNGGPGSTASATTGVAAPSGASPIPATATPSTRTAADDPLATGLGLVVAVLVIAGLVVLALRRRRSAGVP